MVLTKQVLVPFEDGYDVGIGLIRASGEPLVRSIGSLATPPEGAPGGPGSIFSKQIASNSDLEEEIGISADAKAGIGLFRGSARFDFTKRCKVQKYSTVLFIKITRMIGLLQIDEPILTEAAAAAVQDPALFAERFGDCFIRATQRGGQFFGVVRIDSRTQEEKTAINAAVSGSVGTFSADAALKLQNTVKELNLESSTLVHFEGGNLGGVVPQTPEQLVAAAGIWQASVAAEAQAFGAIVAPYSLAGGPRPPNDLELENQRDVLDRCARLRSKIRDNLLEIDYIVEHPDDFVGADISLLSVIRSGFATDLDVIRKAATFALDFPKDAVQPETFAREKLGLPSFAFTAKPLALGQLKGGGKLVPIGPLVPALSDESAFWVNSRESFETFENFNPFDNIIAAGSFFFVSSGNYVGDVIIRFNCNIPSGTNFRYVLSAWMEVDKKVPTEEGIESRVHRAKTELLTGVDLRDQELKIDLQNSEKFNLRNIISARLNVSLDYFPVSEDAIPPALPQGVVTLDQILVEFVPEDENAA